MIPFDDPIPVKGGLMDFTSLHSLSPTIHQMDGGGKPGIDHAFILREYRGGEKCYKGEKCCAGEKRREGEKCCEERSSWYMDSKKPLRHAAVLFDEKSGRQLDLYTTECALIVYTSNWLNETIPFVPVGMMGVFNNSIMPFVWNQDFVLMRLIILHLEVVRLELEKPTIITISLSFL